MNLITKIAQQREFLENSVELALSLSSAHSDGSEVSVTKTTGISVSTRYGKAENIEFNSDGAMRIIVYNKQRKGIASSSDFSEEAIARTVSAALDIARYTSPDSDSGLAKKNLLAFNIEDLDLFYPIELDVERGVSLAANAEQVALKSDSRIIHTEGGLFNSHASIRVFGNSYGMLQSYNSSRHSLSCSVIAESKAGMERGYSYTISRDFNDLCSPQWVGEECARRTVARINSRNIPTMETAVMFASDVATGFFGHLVEAIRGSNVYRKSTFLVDSIGKVILPDWVSIYEYPHFLKGLASSPFDNEGVKTSDHIIVNNGVLSTWLLDSYTARKLKLDSTGHAGGIYNWRVSYQDINFTDLLKEMKRGLLVTELMGQGVNIITGGYSRGASGFWVENGMIQYPVSGITIAGNLKEMMNNIVSISSDIEVRSSIQCGSVLFSKMQIAGQ